MYDATAYTVLITYRKGGEYDAYPMQQLILTFSDYTEEGAASQAKAALALNEDIQHYIINVVPGGTSIKTIK